jgi:hypothetical protein
MARTSTTFQKGHKNVSPGAPKKEWTFTELHKQAGLESKATGVPRSKIVVDKLWEMAENGDIQAIKEIAQRVDGMPKQSNDITSNGKTLKGLIQINENDKSV